MTTVKAAALQSALDNAVRHQASTASQPEKTDKKRNIDVAFLRDMLGLMISALDALDGETPASDEA